MRVEIAAGSARGAVMFGLLRLALMGVFPLLCPFADQIEDEIHWFPVDVIIQHFLQHATRHNCGAPLVLARFQHTCGTRTRNARVDWYPYGVAVPSDSRCNSQANSAIICNRISEIRNCNLAIIESEVTDVHRTHQGIRHCGTCGTIVPPMFRCSGHRCATLH